MLRIGLIGFGYWGRNLARNFHACPRISLAAICDTVPAQLAQASNLYPSAGLHSRADDVIADLSLDAIAIATPTATHQPLALASLRAGKHIWLEKPMTTTSGEAEALVKEARLASRVLFIDHTFVYSPAVRHIRELVRAGQLGTLYYYDSVRANLGRFHDDADVLWDLASHDVSILDYLLDEQPLSIAAQRFTHVSAQPEVAHVQLRYPSGFHAHLHISWLAPVKIRRAMLAGSQQMLLWNDLESVHKLELYEHNAADPVQRRIGYRSGAAHLPWLEVEEPLQTAVGHFADCIQTGARPLTDGERGLSVIQLLERAVCS